MASGTEAAGYVREMTAEYIEKGGWLTCEFSCHPTHLLPVIEAIHEVANELLDKCMARWIMWPCTTCEEHHGGFTLHVEIERHHEWYQEQDRKRIATRARAICNSEIGDDGYGGAALIDQLVTERLLPEGD